MDSLARSELRERKGRKVLQDNQAAAASAVPTALEAAEGRKGPPGNQERRAPPDTTDPRDLLERGGLKGRKEEMESRDLKDRAVQLGKTDFQVTQVKEESRGSKARRGLRDPQVSWGHRANLVNPVPWAIEVTQGHQVYLESTVYQGLLGRKAGRGIQVYLGPSGRVAPRD